MAVNPHAHPAHMKIRMKVHGIDCRDCQNRVLSIIPRIQGVYTVHIDFKTWDVIVEGKVEATTILCALTASGEHAQVLSTTLVGQLPPPPPAALAPPPPPPPYLPAPPPPEENLPCVIM